MMLLEGKSVANQIKIEVAQRAQTFLENYGRKPRLDVIVVGEDPASHVYVKSKAKNSHAAGIESRIHELSGNTTEIDLTKKLTEVNSNPLVDGVLLQLPLPSHLNVANLINLIDPSKDVDALTVYSSGLIYSDQAWVYPCTPWGIVRILRHYGIVFESRKAVVIGRSQIVGKPMAQLLLKENMTVTVAHSKTLNLQKITREADLVVVAAGKPRQFGADFFSSSCVVIDVGIHGSGQGKGICGDVDFESVQGRVAALTPVPGGVGPVTIACLLENTMILAEKRCL